MKISEILTEGLLLEYVKKEGSKYYIYSHKTGKKIGRKVGYTSKKEAVAALLGMKSRGGFYNLSSSEKSKRIKSYNKNHSGAE